MRLKALRRARLLHFSTPFFLVRLFIFCYDALIQNAGERDNMLLFLLIEDEAQRSFMEQLYLDCKSAMYHTAYRVTGQHEDAEDIINDALLKLMNKIPLLMTLERLVLRSYVVISTRRAAIDLLRKRGRRSELLFGDEDFMDTMASFDPDPDEGLLREADEALLSAGLKRLPQRQRDLLNMKYILNMGDREIAGTFGVQPGSVPSMLSRARRALKEMMKELDHE